MPTQIAPAPSAERMGIFRRIETGLERVFEGGIGRTFKSHVQPAELARKLRKEMDDHRTISVSQVYVPNIYTVFLAPPDREQFATYEASLRTELGSYLTEYARRQAYTLPGRVRVVIDTADELEVGLFGIAVTTEEEPRMSDLPRHSPRAAVVGDAVGMPLPEPEPEPASAQSELPAEFLLDDEHLPDEPPAPDVEPELPVALPTVPVATIDPPAASETALMSARDARAAGLTREEWALEWPGGRQILDRRAVVLGRSKECDVVLDDRNVSRRHAELIRNGDGFLLRDLDSTNGCAINGKRVREAPVAPGDTITIGSISLRLETTRS